MPDDEIESLATEIDNDGEAPAQGEKRGKEASAEDAVQPEDAEDEGQDEDPDGVEGEPARRPGRRDARIATLLEAQKAADARAAREEERNTRLERQLEELRGRAGQRQESPEEESARLALMSPEERSDYKLNKALRAVDQVTRQSAFQAQEIADKASFDAKVSMDPLYKRLAPKVYQKLKELRAQGQNVPREILFTLAVGEAALDARNSKLSKEQKNNGAANLRRETTAPLNGKGDQTPARRRAGDTPAKRLDGVSI